MNTIEKIESMLPVHESKFLEVVEKIEKKVVLHKDLQTKLDEIGDTPIDAPEVNEAINKGRTEVATHLLTREEIKEDYTAIEVANFIYAVSQKVTSIRDEEGNFKSTPNTEECDLPNFLEVDELMNLAASEDKIRQDFISSEGKKDSKELLKKLEKAQDKSKNKALEVSGLDIEKLTDWEKLLVVTQVYEASVDATRSSVGKRY